MRTDKPSQKPLFYGKTEKMEENIMLDMLPKRTARSHKGIYGKVLCIAGSKNMAGAAYLCGYAALRTGAGMVRIFTPEANRIILQTLLPEAIMTTYEDRDSMIEQLTEAFSWADTVAIGPGLGKSDNSAVLLEQVMKKWNHPMVVDADGLNLLAERMELLEQHEGPLIVTPHVGEFSRLTGLAMKEISENIPGQAQAFAKTYHCICVLKDAPSAIGDPDRVTVNTTGNNGMSTAGSGDVLTGIIAGLLGQRMDAEDAARLGAWLHGRAGDLAAEKEGTYGLLARHLIEYLPQAMRKGEEL